MPDGTVRRYSFDLDSNRTQVTDNGATVATYTYDPGQTPGLDQMSSATENGQTRTFAYSTDGDMTQRGADTLSWDGWGRHSGGTFGGQAVSYGFDAAGFRRQRVSGPVTTRYLLGGLFETDATGAVTSSDIRGTRGGLARYDGPPTTSSPVSFLYLNGHGDVAAVAGISGTRTAAYTYDPFGGSRQTVPTNRTTERWMGRWNKKLDTQSSLVEMGVRPYDPTLGRFLSRDPIDGGSANAYDYAHQDPVNAYDLDGRYVVVLAMFGARTLPFFAFRGPHLVQVLRLLAVAGLPVIGIRAAKQAADDRRSLPKEGEPNSTDVIDRGGGRGQIRDYGPDGRAKKDFDFGHDHHGVGDPHAHDWDWTKPPKEWRGPPRPIRDDE